ncbi:response regulator transcription factor [Paenibacillus alkalitolerans]|uniref:response regulator transcription factor n=1 Tax=Paenibacillus alkalitolerans TaxID=2799335 RepID=UPI0018F289EC|nr:response regulator transcription factor [Paenibacillus alkalitolerans]
MDRKLLIIDEQPDRGSALESQFQRLGIVERCEDGISGLVKTLQFKPDVIVASSMAPKLSGAELCEQIRASSQSVIIMLSPGSEEERVACYDAGADEVVGCDIGTREIALKAAAWLRRCVPSSQPEAEATTLHFGPLTMNQRTHRTFVGGEEVPLTRKEFAILWMLVSRQTHIVSRNELLRIVWSYESLGDDRMIDTHLNRIRKKLSEYNHIFTIKTVWGIGYKLEKVKAEPVPRSGTM